MVADSRYLTLGEETRPLVYWPFGSGAGDMTIHVRTETDARALARVLPYVLRGVDPRLTSRVRPLRSVMSVALFPAQAAAVALAALGLVGWALTVAGLYGVVAYTVTRRIPEIGVRVALGAPPLSVMRLLLRDGLVLTFVGLTAGLVLAALVTPFLGMFLAGVHQRRAHIDLATDRRRVLSLSVARITNNSSPPALRQLNGTTSSCASFPLGPPYPAPFR